MAQRLKKPCKNPLCPELTDHKSRLCEVHRPKDTRIRDKRYFSNPWRKYSMRYLKIYPKCKCGNASEVVHHIKDVSKGGLFWSPMNHQAMCKHCHDSITAKRRIKVFTYENMGIK